MPVNVELNKQTVEVLKAKLNAARDGLKNEGVAMRQVAVFLDQWVQRNFQSEGGKVGKWEPFKYGGRIRNKKGAKAQSISGKRYIDGSAKLLRDTGALQHSFLPFIRKGIAGIGSELPYSKPHEDGMPTRSLPQRRLLPKTNEVQADIRSILDNFVTVQLRSLK